MSRSPFRKKDFIVRPLARSETIPSSWYTSPEIFDADMEVILGRSWQYLGPASGLDAPGRYRAGDAAGNPVLAIRGNDGALRGFYNVCRHRGGPLVTDEAGECRMLQCRYHGWTYTPEGMLRGVPRFDRVELFDRKEYGLTPVDLAEWEGMLFARLDGRGPAAASVLAPVLERIRAGRIGAMSFHRRVAYDVECNWKVYVDNFLEGYHLPFVHPELCDLLEIGSYVTETWEWVSLQRSPIAGGGSPYGPPGGEAFYFFVFPNFMLNILPGRVQTNLVVPLSPRSTRVLFDYYVDPDGGPAAAERLAADLEYSDRVQREDIGICERVQRGLESRAYDRGRFSVEMERAVHHFQSLLKRCHRRAAPR